MIRILACVFTFFLVLVFASPLFAASGEFKDVSNGQINEALQRTVPTRFLPGHPLYFLITAKENVSRAFQPSSAKRAKFDLILAGKRMKESYLLLKKGNVKGASKTLKRYGQRLDTMVTQFEKARSQNQDVTPLASEIAEDFSLHETLFSAITTERAEQEDEHNFNENMKIATASFVKAILAINNIRPGLKDRFMISTSSAVLGAQNTPEEPTIDPIYPTPSTAPRKIIY